MLPKSIQKSILKVFLNYLKSNQKSDMEKKHNFYTNKFSDNFFLPERVRKLQLNFILDKTA